MDAVARDPWNTYIRQTRTTRVDGEVAAFVLDAVARVERPRALDLGCGGGRHLRFMRARGCRAVGLDGSRAALEQPELPVLLHDLCEPLPLRSAYIDLVLLWGTFVHLTRAAQRPALQEIIRVLRPGGRLMIDYLRPDDFRRALGRPIDANYCESPWLDGVTDYFCESADLLALCDPMFKVNQGYLSSRTRDGELVSQGYLWLERPADGPG